MEPFVIFLIYIGILLFSVVVHEVSHGAVANMLGDPTARLMGRLTLNPKPHIDPIGSILVPLLLMIPALFGAAPVIFGWAKPVPYNPYNLRYKRWGGAIVGMAGPASNFTIAIIFGMALRFMPQTDTPALLGVALIFMVIVYLNLLLGIFNLVPIPPLDGSKLLFSVFPNISPQIRFFLEKNGFIILLAFIFFGFQILFPVIDSVFYFITGTRFGSL